MSEKYQCKNTKNKLIREMVNKNKDKIIAMHKEGKTLKEIAEAFGVSTTTIYYKLIDEKAYIVKRKSKGTKRATPGGRTEKLKPFMDRISKELKEQIKANTIVNNESERFVIVKNGSAGMYNYHR